MENNLIKQLRFLKVYVLISSVVFIALISFAFVRKGNPHFEQIDVERINVVEKDGQLRMVISNKASQHPGIMGGKETAPRVREAGMIFFNGDGDECGGLIFDNDKQEAGFALSVDQYRNDQVLQLNYSESLLAGKKNAYGLQLWSRGDSVDFPSLVHRLDSLQLSGDKLAYDRAVDQLGASGALGKPLMFVGKTGSEGTGVFIRDQQGRPRIRLYVDEQGEGHLEWLDARGKIIRK